MRQLVTLLVITCANHLHGEVMDLCLDGTNWNKAIYANQAENFLEAFRNSTSENGKIVTGSVYICGPLAELQLDTLMITTFENVTELHGDISIWDTDISKLTKQWFPSLERLYGNVNISNNANLVSFQAFWNVTYIHGSIIFDRDSNLAFLDSFHYLTNIGQKLEMIRLIRLSELYGFGELNSSGSITLKRMTALSTVRETTLEPPTKYKFSGFSKLKYITQGSLILRSIDPMTNLSAFQNLEYILQDLDIFNCFDLGVVDTFHKLAHVRDLIFVRNTLLQHVSCCEELKEASYITFDSNVFIDILTFPKFPSLKKLNFGLLIGHTLNEELDIFPALESLENATIEFSENPRLQIIRGFEQVRQFYGLSLHGNPSLQIIGHEECRGSDSFSELRKLKAMSIQNNRLLNSLQAFARLEFESLEYLNVSHNGLGLPLMRINETGEVVRSCELPSRTLSKDGFQCEVIECGHDEVQVNNDCIRCQEGYFKDGNICKEHTVCGAFHHEALAPTSSTDRECSFSYWLCRAACPDCHDTIDGLYDSNTQPCDRVVAGQCSKLSSYMDAANGIERGYFGNISSQTLLSRIGDGIYYKLPNISLSEMGNNASISGRAYFNNNCNEEEDRDRFDEVLQLSNDYPKMSRTDELVLRGEERCTPTNVKMGLLSLSEADANTILILGEMASAFGLSDLRFFAAGPELNGTQLIEQFQEVFTYPTRCIKASIWCVPTKTPSGETNYSSCPPGSLQYEDIQKPNITCNEVALVREIGGDKDLFPVIEIEKHEKENDGIIYHKRILTWNGAVAVLAFDQTYISSLNVTRSDGESLRAPLRQESIEVVFYATDIFGNVASCTSEIRKFTTSRTWQSMSEEQLADIYDGVENIEDTVIYYEDSSYTVRKPSLPKHELFLNQNGEANDISYQVVISPDRPSMFLVDSAEGTIIFIPPSGSEGFYTISLLGVDDAGATAEVRKWQFEIRRRPRFRLSSQWNESTMNTTGNILLIYEMNKTYTVPGPILSKSQLFVEASGDPRNVQYDLLVYSNSSVNETLECPSSECPGRFYVDSSGGVLIYPERKGNYHSKLVAKDDAGSQVVVKSWSFQILPSDLANVSNGPNGRDCTRGTRIDLIAFDEEFTCDCKDTKYNGPNCDDLKEESARMQIVIGVVVGLLGVFLLALVFIKYQNYKQSIAPVDFKADNDIIEEQGFNLSSLKIPKEIRRMNVVLSDILGEGHFGVVHKGMLHGGGIDNIVAAKVLKDTSLEGKREFKEEATVMAQVPYHENVVPLIGVVTKGEPWILIASFCEYGALSSVLEMRAISGPHFEDFERFYFIQDIAHGMTHLAEQRIVHRDLAARNVLVSTGMVCKIADFGMSRKNPDPASNYYRTSKSVLLPVRWCAPEILSEQAKKFTESTDVWSFGVVMLEIFNNGERPYPQWNNLEVCEKVQAGIRASKPHNCSIKLYHIMLQCWDEDPLKRPSFSKLSTEFDTLLAIMGKKRSIQGFVNPRKASKFFAPMSLLRTLSDNPEGIPYASPSPTVGMNNNSPASSVQREYEYSETAPRADDPAFESIFNGNVDEGSLKRDTIYDLRMGLSDASKQSTGQVSKFEDNSNYAQTRASTGKIAHMPSIFDKNNTYAQMRVLPQKTTNVPAQDLRPLQSTEIIEYSHC
eukprot:m.21710 g.21710  ORF g.21710 m.21710 type:complete len:1654 (+) comp7215_c0_seq1:164-5125(+)